MWLICSPRTSFVLVAPTIVVLTHAHGGRGTSRVRVPRDRIAAETLLIVALVDVIGQKLVTLLVDLLVGLADSYRADTDLVRNLVQELMD